MVRYCWTFIGILGHHIKVIVRWNYICRDKSASSNISDLIGLTEEPLISFSINHDHCESWTLRCFLKSLLSRFYEILVEKFVLISSTCIVEDYHFTRSLFIPLGIIFMVLDNILIGCKCIVVDLDKFYYYLENSLSQNQWVLFPIFPKPLKLYFKALNHNELFSFVIKSSKN